MELHGKRQKRRQWTDRFDGSWFYLMYRHAQRGLIKVYMWNVLFLNGYLGIFPIVFLCYTWSMTKNIVLIKMDNISIIIEVVFKIGKKKTNLN